MPESISDLEDVPPSLRALSGTVVQMQGEFLPAGESLAYLVSHIERTGCVGFVPGIERLVRVVLPRDCVVPPHVETARITGTFSVGESRVNGFVDAVYHLRAKQVEFMR